ARFHCGNPLNHVDSAPARVSDPTGIPMPLKFEKNTEAFLAVLTVVAGADNVGSLEERDFLFKKVKAIGIFGNPSQQDFNKLLGKVTDLVYTQLPQQDGTLS